MKTRTLDLVGRIQKRDHAGRPTSKGRRYYTRLDHVRAELDRVARQVRKIRKEVNAPTCEVDAGYKTALNDVLDLIREAQR